MQTSLKPYIIAAGLFLGSIIVYLPCLSGQFLNLDDYQYVVDNVEVRRPSWGGVRRFFEEVTHPTTVAGYYQPLTMLSLMLDTRIAAADVPHPFVYHATNVLFHALNVVLVFVIMRTIFGGMIIPAIMSLFFAIHPVQVESVAWISQRKTVLATFFALAAILTYLHYGKRRKYHLLAATFVLIVLGNLAKPTLMLLPLVLILLDIWPLKRPVLRALPEKLPFLALMLLTAYVAWVSQASVGLGKPVLSVGQLPKWLGLLSYNLMLYFGNIVWPMHLSPYRSIPTGLSIDHPEILLSMAGAIAFAAAVVTSWKWSRPFFVGSMGFVVILLPALGGVQFAASCVADRFLYLPLVFVLLSFGALIQRLSHVRPKDTTTIWVCVVLFAMPLLILTRAQQQVWANTRNLWLHVQSAVPELPKANYNVAIVHYVEGDFKASRDAAAKAVEADPGNANDHYQLGMALTHTGQPDQALERIRAAMEIGLGPSQNKAYIALAEAFIAMGDIRQARQAMQHAETLGVDSPRNLARVGRVAMSQAKNCELAIEYYRRALSKDPSILEIRHELVKTLHKCNRPRESLLEYEEYIARVRQMAKDVSRLERAAQRYRETIQEAGDRTKNKSEQGTRP